MIAGWVQALRRRATFSIRFAVTLGVLGLLIAGATAAIPVQLASSETRSVALDRAADKGGIAINLVSAQRSALRSYVAGVADQLETPLGSDDTAGATAILVRQSTVTDSQDILGASFSPMLRDGAPLQPGDTARAALQLAVTQHRALAVDLARTPWLVEQAPLAAQPGGVVFIARPMRSDFVDRLAADLGAGADAASLALLQNGQFVSGATASGGTVHDGARVPAGLATAAQISGGAVITNDGGVDVAASMRPLSDGVSLLVTTAVGPGSGFLTSVVGPVAVIAVAMILIALIVVFAIVQRDLQRPLRRLDRAVAALEREDFDVPIPAGADDELGRLGRSFERMRSTVRATLAGAEARAEIASELNAAQPLQTALRSVCESLRQTTGAAGALIVVEHSDMADAFVTASGVDAELDAERLLTGGGPINAALSLPSARPLQATAMEGSEEATAGLRELSASPLRMGSHVLGAIAIADKPEGFNAADLALVGAAAEQVTLALERYRILAVAQLQASTDELTGLHNYRFLVDYLDQQIALAERLDSPLAVLMLDLDRFKSLNDSHGHHAGDEALRRFAATLRDTVRRADLAARYGGEEFVVVMANTNREEARLVAEKIRRAVAADVLNVGRARLHITVSIGGVAYPDDTGDARQLLRLADDALYRAKRAGRDRVCFVSDGPRGRTLARAGAADIVDSEADDERHITGHRPSQ